MFSADAGHGMDTSVPKTEGGVHLGDGSGGPPTGALTISPLNQTLNVTVGSLPPTLHYTAQVGSTVVPVSWSLDRGELGTLGVTTGVLTAGETVGGVGHITATYGKQVATTTVTVFLHLVENGASTADAGAGAGGAGGVGGNGPGGPVSGPVETVLNGPPTPSSTIGWLYPYDGTVWPQGLLAPLLQWNAGSFDFDAVYVHVTEASFEYKGYFAKTATPFINEPIPQDAWNALTYSNAGEPVVVSLVFAAGGKAIGPIIESWNIALGSLEGTVYYNSYGTNLAANYCCTIGGAKFGGATLAIKGGSSNPVLIAGSNTECRVCHSVAAGGSTLVTEQGTDYSETSAYDLQTLVETAMSPATGIFAWPALSPDGTYLFSNSSPLSGGTTTTPSGLYKVPSGTAIASTGLPAGLGAACPVFSPDGTHVAFNFYGGTGSDQKSLAWLDYAQSTSVFSGFTTAYTPSTGIAVWPSFFPTNDAVAFELETVSNGRDFAGTRADCDTTPSCNGIGAEGELWWIDQKTKTPTRMAQANGYMTLPTGPNGHSADWELNYEPTMNPVPSGGYAWVVFTSRRMYGNVATINPYYSDPRYHDISVTPTTKKLWVAAIDLNAAPGTDPSHPAFYIPGQELLAGNARGFWVVNPCLANGASCETGDQCCGGYCRAGDGGGLVCGPAGPGCSNEYEKCTTSSDCCGSTMGIECIDDICSQSAPK
jgi:hypothetical protein